VNSALSCDVNRNDSLTEANYANSLERFVAVVNETNMPS
jgi:hypothetical protein